MNIKIFNEERVKGDKGLVNTKIQKDLSETTNQEYCMENKTFYALEGKIVSTYNKSSYAEENDTFLQDKHAFYKFVDKKDHGHEVIEKNVSTEICYDYGLRAGNNPVNIHLIQSNTLNEISAQKLPPAWCYVFCDASIARRQYASRGQAHYYVCTENFDFKHCKKPICSVFSDMGGKIRIEIYKIEQN